MFFFVCLVSGWPGIKEGKQPVPASFVDFVFFICWGFCFCYLIFRFVFFVFVFGILRFFDLFSQFFVSLRCFHSVFFFFSFFHLCLAINRLGKRFIS